MLAQWLDGALLQKIAAENNLAETAFVVPRYPAFDLRWFTPTVQLDSLGLIVTAPGTDCDFVSRFFAPKAGVPEDPVTGSAHSTLIPFWAHRLGKTHLHAKQISARGGELLCEDRGQRVGIAGRAVTYSTGYLLVTGQDP